MGFAVDPDLRVRDLGLGFVVVDIEKRNTKWRRSIEKEKQKWTRKESEKTSNIEKEIFRREFNAT